MIGSTRTIAAIAGVSAAAIVAVFVLSGGSGTAADAADPNDLSASSAVTDAVMTVYKSPTCQCCSAWADHMMEAGFTIETVETDELERIKQEHGVPTDMYACHTAVVDGYVVEGHVPADVVARFLEERPADAAGLAVPGMPIGSPGMEMPGRPAESYEVLAFDEDGETSVYATR